MWRFRSRSLFGIDLCLALAAKSCVGNCRLERPLSHYEWPKLQVHLVINGFLLDHGFLYWNRGGFTGGKGPWFPPKEMEN